MKDNVNKQKTNEIVHIGFEIGLLLKGIHGLLEIIGSVFLLFLTPSRLNLLTRFLTKHELSEDPRDMVANYLLHVSGSFSISAQYFAVFYLMSHGRQGSLAQVDCSTFLFRSQTAFENCKIGRICFSDF